MKFIVLWAGKYPVKFHVNHCGKMYEAVTEAEATRFDDEAAAGKRALEHNLHFGQFKIQEVPA